MRRVTLIAVTALVLSVCAGGLAGRAAADPANSNTLHITLDCGSAGKIPAVFELSSSDSFHVVSFGSNFLWETLAYVTPPGQSGGVDRGIGGGGHAEPVPCRDGGAGSGD